MPPRTKTEEVSTEEGATAAEAAIAEAEGGKPIVVPFRGADFDIPADIIEDARFRIALASGQDHVIVYEALGAVNAALFLTLIKRGESMPAVAAEFLTALNKAAGWGNSRASR